MTRVLILTGAPGVGKTTLLTKIVDALKAKGVSVGGMISREVREGNVRVGFEILDLANGRHGWLAHVNGQSGPQVGKYHVNLDDLDNIGAAAITQALEKCERHSHRRDWSHGALLAEIQTSRSTSVGEQKTGVSGCAWKSQRPASNSG